MIRNLVFDMRGVLYRWEPETALRLYPGEDGRILYDAVYGSPDWRRQDSGEIDEDGMIAAVNLGGDADTIGAVYGQIAGVFYGFDAIPERWLSAIKDREKVDALIERFLSLCV